MPLEVEIVYSKSNDIMDLITWNLPHIDKDYSSDNDLWCLYQPQFIGFHWLCWWDSFHVDCINFLTRSVWCMSSRIYKSKNKVGPTNIQSPFKGEATLFACDSKLEEPLWLRSGHEKFLWCPFDSSANHTAASCATLSRVHIAGCQITIYPFVSNLKKTKKTDHREVLLIWPPKRFLILAARSQMTIRYARDAPPRASWQPNK